jgi:hypothetical protein
MEYPKNNDGNFASLRAMMQYPVIFFPDGYSIHKQTKIHSLNPNLYCGGKFYQRTG